jgi:hypothetical protein
MLQLARMLQAAVTRAVGNPGRRPARRMEALVELLPADATARRACSDLLQETVSATGKLNADGQRRLSKVLHLLAR